MQFTIQDLVAVIFLSGLGIGTIRIAAQQFGSPIWVAIPAAGLMGIVGCMIYGRFLRRNKSSWGEIAVGAGLGLFLLAAVAFYYAFISEVIFVRLK